MIRRGFSSQQPPREPQGPRLPPPASSIEPTQEPKPITSKDGTSTGAGSVLHSDTSQRRRDDWAHLPLLHVQETPPTDEAADAANERRLLAFKSVMAAFRAPIRFAAVYGSAAFAQRGYDAATSPPMADFLLGVSQPEHW